MVSTPALHAGAAYARKSMRGYSTIGFDLFDYIPTRRMFLLALAEREDNQ